MAPPSALEYTSTAEEPAAAPDQDETSGGVEKIDLASRKWNCDQCPTEAAVDGISQRSGHEIGACHYHPSRGWIQEEDTGWVTQTACAGRSDVIPGQAAIQGTHQAGLSRPPAVQRVQHIQCGKRRVG